MSKMLWGEEEMSMESEIHDMEEADNLGISVAEVRERRKHARFIRSKDWLVKNRPHSATAHVDKIIKKLQRKGVGIGW